jgi:hypothetical protein
MRGSAQYSKRPRVADAMGRVMLFEGPDRFGQPEPFPGTTWRWVFQVNPVQRTEGYGHYVHVFKDKGGNRAASRL